MKIREIKSKSKNLIKNNLSKPDILLAFSVLSVIMFTVLPFAIDRLDKITHLSEIADSINKYIYPVCAIVILLVLTVFFIMLLSSVQLGEKAWFSGKNTQRKNCAKRLCYWFKPSSSFKAMRLCLTIFLLKLIWTLIFLLPAILMFAAILSLALSGGIELYLFISLLAGGVILAVVGLIFRFFAVQRYFLAPHLLASNPKLGIIQAIKQSTNLLDGYIFDIVKFKLSFLPWVFPSLLIFPIIYIYPFYKQSCSVIAKEICL